MHVYTLGHSRITVINILATVGPCTTLYRLYDCTATANLDQGADKDWTAVRNSSD